MLSKNQLLFITLVALFCVISPLSLLEAEYVRKDYRNSFLSPELQKDFYQIEVRTTKFLDRQQSSVNGLIESFRGTSAFSFDIVNSVFYHGRGGSLDCHAFTYDDAIAAIAYTLAGKSKKAADLLGVLRKEFYRAKNEGIGLYTSYRTDIPDNGGLSAGIDGDKIHFGPIIWVGVAALQYTAMTGDLKYLPFAIDMAKWAQHQKHFEFPDGGKGGVCMGSGWGPDWQRVYSTENNIDYYAFLIMLKDVFERGNDRSRRIFAGMRYEKADIDRELGYLKRWMKEIVYDTEEGYFYCGYNERGPDKTHALDTVSWAIATFGPEGIKELGPDPFKLMDFAEKRFLVINNVEGEPVEGFDFSDLDCHPGRKQNLVWLEGTGQQIVAYQMMSDYAERLGLVDKAESYRRKAIKFSDEMERISRLARIIDNALPYTGKRPKEKEILLTFAYEWEVPRGHKGQWVGSVSSTVWRYFALNAFNPLAFDTETVAYKLFK